MFFRIVLCISLRGRHWWRQGPQVLVGQAQEGGAFGTHDGLQGEQAWAGQNRAMAAGAAETQADAGREVAPGRQHSWGEQQHQLCPSGGNQGQGLSDVGREKQVAQQDPTVLVGATARAATTAGHLEAAFLIVLLVAMVVDLVAAATLLFLVAVWLVDLVVEVAPVSPSPLLLVET